MGDELLIKYLLKETSPEEDRKVELWIAASEVNRKQLANMELIWSSSRNLTALSPIDENEAWERFKMKATTHKPRKEQIKLWERYGWMKIAAAFILLCGAWLMYNLMGKNETLTAYQETLTQVLPDGSEVTLNKNSVLSYSFQADGDERSVKLEKGEAFFKVTPNRNKPFTIQADKVSIEVVGTSFNVKHTDALTEVIVETGIVKVSEGEQTVELRRGEKVLVENGNMAVRKITDHLYNYYRNNEFVVDNTPLWRLVEVLNDAYDTQIRIESATLRNKTLTTRFRNETLDSILQVVGGTLNCEVIKQGNSYILK